VFLGATKMLNYLQWDVANGFVFAFFVGVWTYTRHYLNIYLLWSVWNDFDKLPAWTRKWSPAEGVWMPDWMRYQIFIPIVLLQMVNLFWYHAIWRILIKAVFYTRLSDDRSDDEDEGVEQGADKEE